MFHQGWPAPPVTFEFDEDGGLAGLQDQILSSDPYLDLPTVRSHMFSFQRQLAGDTILDLTCTGSKSTHLTVSTNTNRYPGDLLDGSLDRLNSNFGPIDYRTTTGSAFGHSISLMLTKRFSRNWSGRAIYTYAKTLDSYSTTGLPQAQVPNSLVVDATDLNRQKGRADFDARQRFVFNATYDFPRLPNAVANNLIGGWQTAAVGVFKAGLPFTVHTTAPSMPTATTTTCPTVRHSGTRSRELPGRASSAVCSRSRTSPCLPAVRRATPGRNTFDHPGHATVDLQRMRVFPIPWATGEGAHLQIRLEALNAFNRVNLTPVIHNLTSPLFGRSTQSILPRKITAGIRIEF